MYRTIFTIDGIAPAYIGYTSGRLWNGWGTPLFEINEAFQVMEEYNKYNDNPMQYDERLDKFFINDPEGLQYEPLDEWKGKNLVTDDGIKHLYGIGAYCWVWDAVNDGDRRYLAQQVEEFIFYHDTYNYMDEYDNRRDKVVDAIIEQFQALDTFHKVICIMRDEELDEDARFEKLGGILIL